MDGNHFQSKRPWHFRVELILICRACLRTHSSQLCCGDAFYLCYLGLSSLTEEVGRKNRHKENKTNEKEEGREREEGGGREWEGEGKEEREGRIRRRDRERERKREGGE